VQIELDAPAVLQHLEADGVLPLEELLLRIDANIEVVKQQIVIGAIGSVGTAQNVARVAAVASARGAEITVAASANSSTSTFLSRQRTKGKPTKLSRFSLSRSRVNHQCNRFSAEGCTIYGSFCVQMRESDRLQSSPRTDRLDSPHRRPNPTKDRFPHDPAADPDGDRFADHGSCGWLALKVGQARVIGEIIGGILIGPSVFGRFAPHLSATLFPISSFGPFETLSTVGLVLFLFLIGMELDYEQLYRQRATALSWPAA
jgi:hypothetical protein